MLNLLIRIMLLYPSLQCVDGRKKSIVRIRTCSMQWKELVQFAEGKGIEQHVVVIGDSVARESYSYLKLCTGSVKPWDAQFEAHPFSSTAYHFTLHCYRFLNALRIRDENERNASPTPFRF